jgi:hypothetical protein
LLERAALLPPGAPNDYHRAVRRLVGFILIATSLGCGSALPDSEVSRPIHVRLVAKGERAEELRVRLERLLISDPKIGRGDDGVRLQADLDLVRCQLMLGGGWGIAWGVRINTVGPPPVEDDCLDALLPAVATLTRERLHSFMSREQPSPRAARPGTH